MISLTLHDVEWELDESFWSKKILILSWKIHKLVVHKNMEAFLKIVITKKNFSLLESHDIHLQISEYRLDEDQTFLSLQGSQPELQLWKYSCPRRTTFPPGFVFSLKNVWIFNFFCSIFNFCLLSNLAQFLTKFQVKVHCFSCFQWPAENSRNRTNIF